MRKWIFLLLALIPTLAWSDGDFNQGGIFNKALQVCNGVGASCVKAKQIDYNGTFYGQVDGSVYIQGSDLSGYVPYIGATSDLNLGVHNLTVNQLNYTTLNPPVNSTVSANAPIYGLGTPASHLYMNGATGSVDGYLYSSDWNTFNNKQPAGDYLTNVDGALYQKYLAAGVVALPSITDNLDGSVTIGTGSYVTYADGIGTFPLTKQTTAGGTFTLVDGSNNYIIYTGLTNAVSNTTNRDLIDQSNVLPIYTIYREGTNLHILDWDDMGMATVNKIVRRFVRSERFTVEPGGLVLGEAATRLVTVTSGYVWYGANQMNVSSYNSSTDLLELWYHSSGNWVKSVVTQYNNSQYDNGTNLASLTGSHYGVCWIFRGIESEKHCYFVLGNGNYSLSQAQGSTVPALPPIISAHAILVGRIIVSNGSSTATQIDSAFTQTFSATPTTDHNALSNLQGGTTGEYYHMTSAQNTLATQYATTAQGGLLSNTDWNTFNGKLSTVDGSLYYLATNPSAYISTVSHGTGLTGSGTSGSPLLVDSTIYQKSLGLVSGTYSDGKACTYTASGTVLNCNTSLPQGAYSTSFTNASLSSHVLTVTHNLGSTYVNVQVYDNNLKQVLPDAVTLISTSQCSVDLTSWGTLTGTWYVVVSNGGGAITGMVYPTSGIVSSNGAGWNASIATTGTGNVVLAGSPTITTPTISALPNLSTNGVVTTSGSNGTLAVIASNAVGGMTLVSAASPLSASSFTMNFTSGNRYKIFVDLIQNTNTGGLQVSISNCTSIVYSYAYVNGTPTGTYANTSASPAILFPTIVNAGNPMRFEITLTPNPYKASSYNIRCVGSAYVTGGGQDYNGSATAWTNTISSDPTSITFSTPAGTITGNAYLYQLN